MIRSTCTCTQPSAVPLWATGVTSGDSRPLTSARRHSTISASIGQLPTATWSRTTRSTSRRSASLGLPETPQALPVRTGSCPFADRQARRALDSGLREARLVLVAAGSSDRQHGVRRKTSVYQPRLLHCRLPEWFALHARRHVLAVSASPRSRDPSLARAYGRSPCSRTAVWAARCTTTVTAGFARPGPRSSRCAATGSDRRACC